jgi:hypothetical protein
MMNSEATCEEAGVGVRYNGVVSGAEDMAIEVDAFCLSYNVRLGVFARAHRKEEGANDDVRYDGWRSVANGRMVGGFKKFPEQSRGGGLLSASRRIYIFKGFLKRALTEGCKFWRLGCEGGLVGNCPEMT